MHIHLLAFGGLSSLGVAPQNHCYSLSDGARADGSLFAPSTHRSHDAPTGRPKPPEPKRSQAAAPADEDVDMPQPPSPSPGQTSKIFVKQRVGIGTSAKRKVLFPPDHQSQTQALPTASLASPPIQGLPMRCGSSAATPMEAAPTTCAPVHPSWAGSTSHFLQLNKQFQEPFSASNQ